MQANHASLSTWLDRGRHIPRHTHTDTHVHLVLSGWYKSDCCPDACPAGTAILNPAGTTHSDRCVTAGGRFLTVSIDSALGAPGGPSTAYRDCPEAWLALRLYRELTLRSADAAEAMDALVIELLARVSARRGAGTSSEPPWLGRAVEMLEDCVRQSIRVTDVAAAVDVHPFHLARVFRRFRRCTPIEYVRYCRVRRAGGLLRSTRQSLADIAAATGFCDQSEFTKTFRRVTGCTPAVYRREFADVGFAQDTAAARRRS
jgi:AraC family transcriptional regulator